MNGPIIQTTAPTLSGGCGQDELLKNHAEP